MFRSLSSGDFLMKIRDAILYPTFGNIPRHELSNVSLSVHKNLNLKNNFPAYLLPRLKAGYLTMEDSPGKWKDYVVALAGFSISDLALYYYTKSTEITPTGIIQLHSAHIDTFEELIMIVTQDGAWYLCAETVSEAEEWANKIRETLENIAKDGKLDLSSHQKKIYRHRSLDQNTHETLQEVQYRNIPCRVQEFKSFFELSSPNQIKQEVIRGILEKSCMRGICWRVWLGYFKEDEKIENWVSIARSHRNNYDIVCSNFTITDEEIYDVSRDMMMDCAEKNQEPINQEIEQNELLFCICKDVIRTQISTDFFREKRIQYLLVRILYRYSRTHSEISYNQGMSDILAIILYLFHIEKWPEVNLTKSSSESNFVNNLETEKERNKVLRSTSSVDIASLDHEREKDQNVVQILRELTDKNFIEHDVYSLLELVMQRMAGLFCPTRYEADASKVASHENDEDLCDKDYASSALRQQLDRVHNIILKQCDPILSDHFKHIHLEPEMYLLRWTRLLMSREFPIPQVWKLWDAIFSISSNDFSFLDYICVAAVKTSRNEILHKEDIPSVLRSMRELNDRVQVDKLIESARELHKEIVLKASEEVINKINKSC